MLQGEQSQVKVNSLAEKWAPLVWLASDEKYFPLSVEEFLQHVDPIEKDGRIISGENMLPVGRTSKSLYLIPKKGLSKQKPVGNHIGDFEHISFAFDENFAPQELFLALHDIGIYYTYDPVSKIFINSGYLNQKGITQTSEFPSVVRTLEGRPILFAAKGSHGFWSAPGKYYYFKLPKLADITDYGTPWKTWKHLQIYREDYDKPPVWMRYFGRWGNPKSNCFLFSKIGLCEFSDGPYGISQRKNDFQC
ncbi:protein eva-1 [Holotrichia oblita]|uniref:Protein eva-1 n=1 Tax=Holotrichia oblita TaxID=644536 RepID=A0ACB9SUL6_HOLOL|nr:protein eva-1 [Holotrichia oblita]